MPAPLIFCRTAKGWGPAVSASVPEAVAAAESSRVPEPTEAIVVFAGMPGALIVCPAVKLPVLVATPVTVVEPELRIPFPLAVVTAVIWSEPEVVFAVPVVVRARGGGGVGGGGG